MSARVVGYEEVVRLAAAGAQVVDALPAGDYAEQHLPGAINLPLEDFSEESLARLDRERDVITYCADNQCDLSARLAARLSLEGFEVYEYAASLADWAANDGALEGENAQIARAGHVARRDVPTCAPDDAVRDVLARLEDHTVCAVVDYDGVLLGRLRRADIERDPGARARDLMHSGPSTFRPDVYIAEMADWFRERPHMDAFLITTPGGRLVGVLYRSDVERAMSHHHRAKALAGSGRGGS